MRHIFLHGLGQDAHSWEGTLSALKMEGECPELYAFFEHGESSYQSLYRGFSRYCGQMDAPLCLCGLSLGAVLALHYALDHPERIGALVLIAPQYKMPKGLLRMQNVLFRLMPQSAFGEMGLGKKDMLALTGSMMELDLTRGLGEVKSPVAVLCGERDKTNRKAAKALAGAIPGAVFRTVKGAGHEVNREAPGELAKLLKEFLEQVPVT